MHDASRAKTVTLDGVAADVFAIGSTFLVSPSPEGTPVVDNTSVMTWEVTVTQDLSLIAA